MSKSLTVPLSLMFKVDVPEATGTGIAKGSPVAGYVIHAVVVNDLTVDQLVVPHKSTALTRQ